jgi:hypothetical protein
MKLVPRGDLAEGARQDEPLQLVRVGQEDQHDRALAYYVSELGVDEPFCRPLGLDVLDATAAGWNLRV